MLESEIIPELMSIAGAAMGFIFARVASWRFKSRRDHPFYEWPSDHIFPALLSLVIVGLLVSWVNTDNLMNGSNWDAYGRRDMIMSFVITGLLTTMVILKRAYRCTIRQSEERLEEVQSLRDEVSDLKGGVPMLGRSHKSEL